MIKGNETTMYKANKKRLAISDQERCSCKSSVGRRNSLHMVTQSGRGQISAAHL